ncbi:MAG: GNAT family N-acetyltransferase [Deltaproteobacteria bacterium]|nr:GNAT family N-acetyltransferase [Deltaproteobacteria bacterium]
MGQVSHRTWKVRPYRDGDEELLPDLYKSADDMPFDFRYWQWLFKANPAGSGYVWLAEDDGVLTGQYAIIPTRMHLQGKPIRCAQSVAAVTHPNYRRQGIFKTLARAVFEETRLGDVNLGYAFPNDPSRRGHVKHVDFSILEKLTTWVRPLNFAGVLNTRIKNQVISNAAGKPIQFFFNALYPPHMRSDADIQIESTSRIPKEVDDLFETCTPRFQNLVVRDYEYLKWRYQDHPTHSYRMFLGYRGDILLGYCVCGSAVRKGIEIGLIMDLFLDPDDRDMARSLIGRAVEYMAEQNMMLAACILTSKSPFLKQLKSLGFICSAKTFTYVIRNNSDKLDLSTLRHVRDWHITFGDADFV